MPPPDAVMVMVYEPRATVPLTASAKFDEPLPPVTVLGVNVGVTPAGRPETLRVTSLENPKRACTLTVTFEVLFSPAFTTLGEMEPAKSGEGGICSKMPR